MSYVIYSYGTLRPGNKDIVKIKGCLYDLGWFPGIKLAEPGEVICERIEVDDLVTIDKYEGYYEKYPDESLFIRKPILDGFIYEFNSNVNPVKKIQSGDWLDYRKEKRGENANIFC